MSRLYLITGFLGAGKTTFLKQFIHLFHDSRIHIIVNEFGKEGIDGELMSSLGIALDEISNGSIFCTCRLDKFEEVLQRTLSQNPDVIVVEASGLSDPTNVRKILNQREKFKNVEYQGCICLADAKQFLKVYHTASVVKKQLNVSDLLLLNKVDLVEQEQILKVRQALQGQRPDLPIYETSFGQFQEEWLDRLDPANTKEDAPLFQTADITLRKYLLSIKKEVNLAELQGFLKMILEDTYRIKGFVYTGGNKYLVSGVGNLMEVTLYHENTEKTDLLVVLSGAGMPVKRAIKTAMEWYPGVVEKIE